MRCISRTTFGTPGRDPTFHKGIWTFYATHKRNNKCQCYICSEERIEAYMSTLVHCCAIWMNMGEHPYIIWKDGI